MNDRVDAWGPGPWWKSVAARFFRNGNGERANPALAAYAAEVAAATDSVETPDRARVQALLARPAELGFRDEDVELEIEKLEGVMALLDLQNTVTAAGPPTVSHQHKAIAGERCHFVASSFLVSAPAQPTGRLFLTERRLVFVATPLIALPWGAIAKVVAEGRDLIIAAPGRGALHQFRCNSFADARCARYLADWLRQSQKG